MRDDENKKLGEAPDEEKENKDEKSSENNAENKDNAPSQNGKGKKPFADLAQRLITAVFIAVLYVGFILFSPSYRNICVHQHSRWIRRV